MSKKITTDIFKKRVYEKFGDSYSVIGEYVNKETPVEVIHLKCGTKFNMNPHRLITSLNKNNNFCMCPTCSPTLPKKYSISDVQNIFDNHYGYGEYEIISYESNKKNMKICHNSCGLIFNTLSLTNWKKNNRACPNCESGFQTKKYKKRLSISEINEYLNSKKEFSLISKYRINRNSNRLDIMHNCCGTIFTAEVKNIMSGPTCPVCKKRSKGERAIQQFLKRYNIDFIEQYTFDDCVYINKLKFDFFLPEYGICIEYDGEFHYMNIRNKLEITKIRDEVKNEYCLSKNIPLIRIPYTSFISNNLSRDLKSKLISKNNCFENIFKSSTTMESINNVSTVESSDSKDIAPNNNLGDNIV